MFDKFIIILGIVELLSLIPLIAIAGNSEDKDFWRKIFLTIIISALFFIIWGILK